MKKQAFNPYLPANEYIPDAEPYQFGDRVYIYGSHDRFDFPIFCANHYVCYSAPVDDLADWRYEGEIFKKNQDPKNKLGLRLLFAPDVTLGPDNRYYLYYAFDFMGIMGVAVSDRPQGPYDFYGHVHYANGDIWGRRKGDSFPFDPGVLVDDDQRVYLYSGFYTEVPRLITGGKKLKYEGGYVLELEKDMVTIKSSEKLLFPKEGPGAFKNHEFFEASSIRKIDGKYYFVYSSRHNHELCYAISDKPTEGFEYKGTLISNGDVFEKDHNQLSQAVNYMGNNHGGILEVNQTYYIFYHRHTHRTSYSRQACAERLIKNPDGTFNQAQMTSCGLNGGPLRGSGEYESRIACHLSYHGMTGRYDIKHPKRVYKDHPFITQDKKDGDPKAIQYIANIQAGAMMGYKSFEFNQPKTIGVEVKGLAEGFFDVYTSAQCERKLASIKININHKKWTQITAPISPIEGDSALYFVYRGKGKIAFKSFKITNE